MGRFIINIIIIIIIIAASLSLSPMYLPLN